MKHRIFYGLVVNLIVQLLVRALLPTGDVSFVLAESVFGFFTMQGSYKGAIIQKVVCYK